MSNRKMSAKQFLAKYPAAEINTNTLLDIGCPKCGNRGWFRIKITTMANAEDDGTSGNDGDHEWGQDSRIECRECWHRGVVRAFTFKGLDALIEKEDK